MMNGMRELRLALRALIKRPGFSATAVLTLGLGIGAVTAIFTFVNAILLQPLPYPESDRIVEIRHHAPAIDLPELNNSPGTLALYREEADWFESITGMSGGNFVLTADDRTEEVEFLLAHPEMFEVFRTAPKLGRPIRESDVVPGAPRVAVLLHDTWQTRYGGEPGILGRTLELDGQAVEIVGVMPEDFTPVEPGPLGILPLTRPEEPAFGQFGTAGFARLADGVTLEQAQARMEALQARIPERFAEQIPEAQLDAFGWSVSTVRLLDEVVEDVVGSLWLVMGTVAGVLLIAIANVANLFLVRSESRQKELAVRSAMGAGRARLAGSFLSEAVILGVAGGLLGVLVAAGGVGLLVRHGPQDLPRLHEVAITPSVLALAGLLSVVATLFLAYVPLARRDGGSVAGILRDGSRGSTDGVSRHRARNALVVSQLALALVLLVGSGLMFRTFAELRRIDPGFDGEGVLTVGMSVRQDADRVETAQMWEEIRQRVAALPGVEAAAVTTQVPLASGNANGGSFNIESRPRDDDEIPPVAMYSAVGPGYFEAMGIPLVAGRDMVQADVNAPLPRVWISQSFADTHFDGGGLGERVTWSGEEAGEGEWAEVTGIVGTVTTRDLRQEPGSDAYFALGSGTGLSYPQLSSARVVARVAEGGAASSLAPGIREVIADVDRRIPVTQVETVDEILSRALAGESVTLVLLGIAATLALFLGSIGLFGVISYVVTQRTREIGLRMALGAEVGAVRSMVLWQGLRVAAVGIGLGLVGAFALTRWMSSVLYGVSARDPLTFGVAPVVLLLVALLATWLPARRASRVDPMESLRSD
jgi:predicted permease